MCYWTCRVILWYAPFCYMHIRGRELQGREQNKLSICTQSTISDFWTLVVLSRWLKVRRKPNGNKWYGERVPNNVYAFISFCFLIKDGIQSPVVAPTTLTFLPWWTVLLNHEPEWTFYPLSFICQNILLKFQEKEDYFHPTNAHGT